MTLDPRRRERLLATLAQVAENSAGYGTSYEYDHLHGDRTIQRVENWPEVVSAVLGALCNEDAAALISNAMPYYSVVANRYTQRCECGELISGPDALVKMRLHTAKHVVEALGGSK